MYGNKIEESKQTLAEAFESAKDDYFPKPSSVNEAFGYLGDFIDMIDI